MGKTRFEFEYDVYESSEELTGEDAALLDRARKMTAVAYAPYSNFFVGAVARLVNGEIVAGTNQENASYPVGICAERVLLGNAATSFPGVAIDTLAVSYDSKNGLSDHPISPCGMCRQALLEYEARSERPIRVILAGQTGEVLIVKSTSFLLPFAFRQADLG